MNRALRTITENENFFPQDAWLFLHQFQIAGGHSGGIIHSLDAAQKFAFFSQQTSGQAVGDALETSVVLDRGIYTMSVLGMVFSSYGILNWMLDGNVFAQHDWYNASLVRNTVKTAELNIAYSGRHLLRMEVISKNASSSSYLYSLTAVWFNRNTRSSRLNV